MANGLTFNIHELKNAHLFHFTHNIVFIANLFSFILWINLFSSISLLCVFFHLLNDMCLLYGIQMNYFVSVFQQKHNFIYLFFCRTLNFTPFVQFVKCRLALKTAIWFFALFFKLESSANCLFKCITIHFSFRLTLLITTKSTNRISCDANN